MALIVPEDITDALRADGHLTGPDWNPEDRVYAHGDDRVKVKTWHDAKASGHGREVYRFSGSIVGPDGKAIRRDNGEPAVQDRGHSLTVHADSETNLIRDIERERFECVRITVRAEALYRQAGALTGVGLRR